MLRSLFILLISWSAVLPALSYDRVDSLIENVLAKQLLPSFYSLKYCSYTRYEKTQLSLHDIDAFNVNGKLANRRKWLRAILEATGASDTLTIPVITDQRVIRTLWRLKPEKEIQEVMAINREGLNEVFDAGDFADMMMERKFPDFSIYLDTIMINGISLMSPVGYHSSDFYDYKLVAKDSSTMVVMFTPKTKVDIRLSGLLTLEKDSIWRIKRTEFQVKDTIFRKDIDDITITHEYVTTPKGKTILHTSDYIVELRDFGFLGRVQYRNTQVYSDFSSDSIPDKKFRHKSKLKYNKLAEFRGPEYWAAYDKPLSEKLVEYHIADSLYDYKYMVDTAGVVRHRQSVVKEYLCAGLDYLGASGRGMKILSNPLKALVNNYVEIGNPPIFNLQPVYSFASFNRIDKLRLRVGGFTTANLFKRLFLGGYVAYGFGSKNVYYRAKALYSFIDKAYEPTEFPKRNVSFESRNDICYLGERNNHVDHDNIFKSFQWGRSSKLMYYNMQKLEMEWDHQNGIGYVVALKKEVDRASNNLSFHTNHEINNSYNTDPYYMTEEGSVNTSEVRFEFLYYPASKRFTTRKRRLPVNTEIPSIMFSHSIGFKALGGNYYYHVSELTIDKEWYLGIFGIGRTMLKVGKIWNQVPFPLLLAPPANVSYFNDDDDGTFNLIYPFEFANDSYAQLILSLETNGNIIGKIPFIKRLHWKEYISFRMLWGSLSDKNNPELAENHDSDILMPFPVDTKIMNEKTPYIEGAIGIHKIFHILNVDYVHRFTYRNIINGSCGGIRVMVNFDL